MRQLAIRAEVRAIHDNRDVERLFFSPGEVAEKLGRSTRTVLRAIAAGEIPHERIGGSLLVPAAWLADLEQRAFAQQRPPWPPAIETKEQR